MKCSDGCPDRLAADDPAGSIRIEAEITTKLWSNVNIFFLTVYLPHFPSNSMKTLVAL